VVNISAMDHIREGFVLLDESDNYLISNPAAVEIFPGITKLLKGESIFSVKSWPDELRGVENGLAEFSICDRNLRHFRASVSPVLTQNRTLIAKIILLGDITDNVILMKKLENAAYIDALTGIYNRKHFFELAYADIERAQRLSQPIYTAMLDLDFFKNVNDTYGHAAGDLVLVNTAAIIRQTIRSYDLLCRYGGEEFLLLITNADENEAFNLMERIRENMELGVTEYEETKIKITCSIGLAKFVENDILDNSIKKADEALYAAKNSGRNLVKLYDPE
jgi:diguanylate cyclase (GGDEF)-like protein